MEEVLSTYTYEKEGKTLYLVSSIIYDSEVELFLVEESIDLFHDFATSLCFYINFEGEPVGFGYLNGFEFLIPLEFTSMRDSSYLAFLSEITRMLKEQVRTQTLKTKNQAKKLLGVFKEER